MPKDNTDKIKRLLRSEEETRPDLKPVTASPRVQANTSPVRLDANNMPLPRRVSEVDSEGTRVQLAISDSKTTPRRAVSGSGNPKRAWGCFVYGLIGSVFLGIVVVLIGVTYALYQYYSIARALPSVDDLQSRASQFETTRILDRNGNSLYEITDPNAGRRTFVPLEKISPSLVAATIATEDKDFYTHPGFDAVAIIRALWENYRTGGQGGGASTITQQLARALLLTPEERAQRTISRKAREIILAAELTRRYSKDEILELYLNEIYYGNRAYGIEAAAETYFHTTADKLTFAQSAFLAGLPQSPSVYDIYLNRDATLARNDQVLVLMYALSTERNCITVSNSAEPVCVDAVVASQSADEIRNFNFPPPDINIRYPHWVNYVRYLLEQKYDAQTIYRSGFTVYTTLDPALQDEAQRILSEQVATLADKNAFNGALVAIQPSTGEILVMVGSADFYNDAIGGQNNMAVSQTRQPGSSIKPIAYVAAFEKGWTPSTLIWDVPTDFPDGVNPAYQPLNYDGKFHGPVTVRVALSNSFNIPAVKTLQFIGVYDDPSTPKRDGMIEMAERLGITSLTAPDYGLALTLGGGEVSLLEMTGAYAVFANGGKRVPPVAILRIEDFAGNVIDDENAQGEQIIRAEHAYLISSILSDNEARSWMFGPNSVLNLPFPAAVKTGTSGTAKGDERQLVFDNWTIGYTPDIVSGVWIGNADYTPMLNTTGSTGAAPIWSAFMQYAAPKLTNGTASQFVPPQGIIEKIICAISGTEPSQWCRGGQQREIFAFDQLPLPASKDLLRKLTIDTWTKLEASPACNEFVEEAELAMRVDDPFGRAWLGTLDGKNWLDAHNLPGTPVYAPERECRPEDPHPTLAFSNLKDGEVISDSELEIKGSADVTSGGFKSWTLDIRADNSGDHWDRLAESSAPVKNNTLAVLDFGGLQNGTYILRLRIEGARDAFAEKLIRIVVNLPIPPTSIPPTPTATATPTATLPPPPTDLPTDTPTDTPTPTDTEVPPLPTDTETPSGP